MVLDLASLARPAVAVPGKLADNGAVVTVLHTWARQPVKFHFHAERNSRGMNWETSIDCDDMDVGLGLLAEVDRRLRAMYGQE